MIRLTLGYVVLGTFIDPEDFSKFCQGRPGVWYAQDVGTWVTTSEHAYSLWRAYKAFKAL